MVRDTIFYTVGGLGLFLFGMKLMSDGLRAAAGRKLKRILESMTKRAIVALLIGAGVTALVQSSSATTVMVIGFVVEFRRSHVGRMRDGLCSPESELIFIDLVDNVEKIGDPLRTLRRRSWEGCSGPADIRLFKARPRREDDYAELGVPLLWGSTELL